MLIFINFYRQTKINSLTVFFHALLNNIPFIFINIY